MATNGGALQSVPLPPRANLNCPQCGVLLDSVESLNVHMHYHSENINRWGAPSNSAGTSKASLSTASQSPTDSENNNHTKHHHSIQVTKNASPLHNTVSAAADSSDNQRTTPQPTSASSGGDSRNSVYVGYNSGSNSPYQHQTQPATADMHYAYMHPYEQYYHHPNMDFGLPPSHFSQPPQHEYKPVPSPRYHPYINHSLNQPHQTPNSGNSSLSPRVVSSSSPTQNNLMQAQSGSASVSNSQAPPGQPTPSPSPKQCDKCGFVCETAGQLSEHYSGVHGANQTDSLNRTGSDDGTDMPNFPYSNYVKEEPPCDILDLDSQKMVYPPHDGSNQGPLPPMHSLHPMQRPAMIWPHDHHAFIPPHPQEIKSGLYGNIKSEYSNSVPIKQEFSPPTLTKSEYALHQTQLSLQQQDTKSFNNEVSGNQVTTSPSEFPSTTTPQENGAQFRTFEAATSSLPNNTQSTKSSSWKSNEARRPKTYNCTACNKWFTSSGHLKRHYNTTLHKNAVKSSGQPDPATMPISVHHHPSRDQNKNHHHRGSPAQPPQPAPPEPPRSPEYAPQYTPPLGFQQTQAFQQYGTAIHSNSGGPPNGQAGPSVLASQPRGLQIYTTNTGTQQVLQEQEQIFMHQTPLSNNISSAEVFSITTPITINTNTTILSYPVTPHQEALQQSYHTIIGNSADMGELSSDTILEYGSMMDVDVDHSSYSTSAPCGSSLGRLTGGAAAYQGDTAPPFSPDVPESFQTVCQEGRSATPHQMAATAHSSSSPSPCSPSITSTGTPAPAAGGQTEVIENRCIPCDKVFNKACYLTQHNKTFHSGEKPYKCLRCGKRFPCGQTHEEHYAKHAGEKPFKCDQCPKQFNHKTDLRRHMCLHSGTKPYACETCGKGFIRKDHMMKHCETHRRKSANLAKKNGDLN